MSSVLIHYYRDHSGLLSFLKNSINSKKKNNTENKTDLMPHLPDSPESRNLFCSVLERCHSIQ